jgi:hypothetical protein
MKDKELVDLYRVRDNDEFYKKPQNKGLLYSNHNVISQDGRLDFIVPKHYRGMFRPSNDPTWRSMNDEERIENGLMSDFWYTYCASPKAMIGMTFFTSMYN